MKTVAIFHKAARVPFDHPNQESTQIELEGVSFRCGLIDLPTPEFDPYDERYRSQVLIRIRAFSCNFRDKALVFAAQQKIPTNGFYAIGSEFAAEVVAVGSEVGGLKAGDRVIGNNHYSGNGLNYNGQPEGIPTNHASKEYQVIHYSKLILAPPEMTDVAAAGFSVGAQTAYSMMRKLLPTSGESCLVLTARSNTALFMLQALKIKKVLVFGVARNGSSINALRKVGYQEVFCPEHGEPRQSLPAQLFDFVKRNGGFRYVVDPFFDLHLPYIHKIMSPGGKYITCGLLHQIGGEAITFSQNENSLTNVFSQAILRNITLIANCLGLTDDLQQAFLDYRDGSITPLIDSVFHEGQEVDFLQRTFSSPERIGKVIYLYT